MAPFEMTVFSFVDAEGAEQKQTMADAEAARAYAAQNRLMLIGNTYEFVTSEPLADFTGRPVAIVN